MRKPSTFRMAGSYRRFQPLLVLDPKRSGSGGRRRTGAENRRAHAAVGTRPQLFSGCAGGAATSRIALPAFAGRPLDPRAARARASGGTGDRGGPPLGVG